MATTRKSFGPIFEWIPINPLKSIEFSAFSITDLFIIVVAIYGTEKFVVLLGLVYRGIRNIFIDDLIEDYRESRDDQRISGSIPNGWMPVVESQKLTNGSVLKACVNGKDIVLLRDSNGTVHAMDPYCPHNGAHLGFGEVVKIKGSDCIKCPFHEWSFRAEDGVCVDVPYAKDRKAPKGSTIKIHSCKEMNGSIYIWIHSKEIEPSWLPEPVENISSGKFKCIGRSEFLLRSNILTIAENNADFHHLDYVHDKRSPAAQRLAQLLGLKQNIIHQVRKNPTWRPDKHKGILTLDYEIYLFGIKVAEFDFVGTQFGPFYSILSQRLKIFGKTFEQVANVGIHSSSPNEQRIIAQLFTAQDILSKLIGRLMLHSISYILRQDCVIWQDIKRPSKPLYLKEEKTMAEHCRWFMHFYDGKKIGSKGNISEEESILTFEQG
ncbi:cholesterol 7-desaturase nvd-like [Brevipalpus obovatus]|uniref:cholesterol 7-desaturase nvd-like n=1 Tax=Brevipalpus obovatus TaxID=246614 RepID=UPI003D9E8AAA